MNTRVKPAYDDSVCGGALRFNIVDRHPPRKRGTR